MRRTEKGASAGRAGAPFFFGAGIRAERRLGELIVAQKETVGLNGGGWRQRQASCGSTKEPQDVPPTLAQAGIDKKLSARSQKIASIPEEDFEQQQAGSGSRLPSRRE